MEELTEKEEIERMILLEYQKSSTRWMSQQEFDRLKELNEKPFRLKKPLNYTNREAN
jgi:hypothetical protein